MFQKQKITQYIIFAGFLLLSLTLYASEHEEKKEPTPAEEPAKEHGSSSEHGEKKPAEKEKKPNKDDIQETLLHPNRVRVQELNFSRFGPNDKVIGIISLFFYIEFAEEKITKKVINSMPRLRSELVSKLTEYASNTSKNIQDKGFKLLIKKTIEKLYGQKTVGEIIIFKSFERKL